ncbi:hypothetical protein [Paenibacillus silvae]|uniref:hypothetical protein n=1 Tax=Paenibacillus silvae TaxID=1325358 RepID=UPI0011B70050|nr:hypothetical protein [Paenibacillus silvae]
MVADMKKQFDRFHLLPDKPIEMTRLNMELRNLTNRKRINFEKGPVTFSPFSTSKCEREMFYKALKVDKDEQVMLPHQKRWLRNGSAIYDAVQKDKLNVWTVRSSPLIECLTKHPHGSKT